MLIAVVSTIVFLALLALLATQSPGWEAFKAYFLDWQKYRESFPEIARAFLINVRIFVIAEAIILVTALGLAVLEACPARSSSRSARSRSSTRTSFAACRRSWSS